ncbi:hypothetical protein BDV29DRAFT_110017 [Aspergillus leporis]|uniref:Glycine zipper 2TM domain-containing protein n=1 Tax=Aspergillus leporis TaxID=41062 RepID=A0A5N5WFR6_9EURO|nr:hypothetical protein BDV29DRAFT_110017 [Aspergillus leporis]
MSDPYAQSTNHTPLAPGAGANFYAPPESLYQNPPHDYEYQQPYGQQFPPSQNHQYGSQYDLTQTPRSYPPQASGPQQDYLSPSSAEGFQQGRNRQGSNAEYYNVNPNEQDQYRPSSHQSYPSDTPQEANNTSNEEENERNLGGALVGGASGYYLGHQRDHGFLGAVGGALLGNFIGDKIENQSEDDKDHHHRHSDHHHSHKHRHGNHEHHHHSHHRHHRSHSRHSSHSGGY